jgi:hypothetical protein
MGETDFVRLGPALAADQAGVADGAIGSIESDKIQFNLTGWF